VGTRQRLHCQGSDAVPFVAYDFGVKRNIFAHAGKPRLPSDGGPAQTSAAEVLALNPDGVFL